jgi:hypothetical protein
MRSRVASTSARGWVKHTRAALALWLQACSTDGRPEPLHRSTAPMATASGASPTGVPVHWFGALHSIMHEGRTTGAVRLADVVPGPHAWALGALEGLHGEVTVLDDVAWLAVPSTEGRAEPRRADLSATDGALQAALLVVANVAQWTEGRVARDVPSAQLDSYLRDELRRRGHSSTTPVPVRIEGPVVALRWHVVDGSKLRAGATHADHARTAISGLLEQTDVSLIGFFSEHHQGVFTHAGSSSHFHVVSAEPVVSGHVDEVVLSRGARLLLPAF